MCIRDRSEDKQEEYYTKYWSSIEKDCSGKDDLDNFIRDYLTIKSPIGDIPKFQDVYPAFKSFAEGKEIEPIMAEMKRYASLYKRIKSARVGDASANEIMSRLNYLELTITYAYLLGLLAYAEEQNMPQSEITDIFSCIEIFVFRRLICGYPTNALLKMFATLHQQVLKNKKEGDTYYDAFDFTGACGFLIGNEGNGLSDEIAECADCYLKIPMEGKVESLNAAVSAALLMYECKRQRGEHNENMV